MYKNPFYSGYFTYQLVVYKDIIIQLLILYKVKMYKIISIQYRYIGNC